MRSFYAGIGSRETPIEVCARMTAIATRLHDMGWWLASGHAKRADQAFEDGAGDQKEIFLARHATQESLLLAEKYHPAWDRCDAYARKLHARNGLILLGPELVSPVNFVACWTPDGKASGGTGQALRIAADPAYAIPVFNLFYRDAEVRLMDFVSSFEAM